METVSGIDGMKILDKPRILYDARHNSAQLIYGFHLAPTEGTFEGIVETIENAEGQPPRDCKREIMEVHRNPKNLVLVEINNRALTDRVCRVVNGQRYGLDPQKIRLSEAFAPVENAITNQSHILLTDYLARQN